MNNKKSQPGKETEVPSKKRKVEQGVCIICRQNDSSKKVIKFNIYNWLLFDCGVITQKYSMNGKMVVF